MARPFAPEVPFRAHLPFHPDARRSRQVKAFTALLLDAGSLPGSALPAGSGGAAPG